MQLNDYCIENIDHKISSDLVFMNYDDFRTLNQDKKQFLPVKTRIDRIEE
jgi:hypothetical protein